MSRFTFCNCPAGFSADPARHAPDCPGRFGAGKAPTPVPATYKSPSELERVTAERNALQIRLNERDDLDDQLTSLEQRRHAEQQACRAAERRVKELETQLAEVREDLDECDGDRHRLRDKCAVLETFAKQMARQEGVPYYASLAKAALNPTAEAVSHDQ